MRQDPILFVDDDFMSHLLNCEMLRQRGFAVLEASSARDACAAIEQYHFSALVTDIDLGDGADGFEIARVARAADPDLPVVYMSGTAACRYQQEGVPASQFLAKPCAPEQIMEALDQAIAEPRRSVHQQPRYR